MLKFTMDTIVVAVTMERRHHVRFHSQNGHANTTSAVIRHKICGHGKEAHGIRTKLTSVPVPVLVQYQ